MKNWHIYVGLIILVVIILVLVRSNAPTTQEKVNETPTAFDDFAQCLADAGALFYGAFWCPHCKDQKDMFDNSSKLPYIECSTINRQQTQECTDAGITGYPTWVFADGSREEGTVPMATLSEKTGCQLAE